MNISLLQNFALEILATIESSNGFTVHCVHALATALPVYIRIFLLLENII